MQYWPLAAAVQDPALTAEAVRDALTRTVVTLPARLRLSLTWDQGNEMSQHRLFTIAADVPVYFYDLTVDP